MAASRVGACVDQLGDHGIIEHRDFAAFVDAGIVAHRNAVAGRLLRWPVAHETPDRGQKTAIGIFSVDAALDRPTLQLHIGLLEGQLFAGGDPDHQLDQIEACDHLGDGMLDLQAGVHFQEEERTVLARDEFHGARAVVTDGLGEGDGLLAHGTAGLLVEQR